jgi:hypothetical protein
MTHNVAKLAVVLLTALAPLTAVGIANADPANCAGFHDPRLCDLSKVYYCPDTGNFVPALTTCRSYVTGPHRAGMSPDDVTQKRGDDE